MTVTENDYPGARLGLPESGAGSIAHLGRRVFALILDYTAATLLAVAFFRYDPWALPAEAGVLHFAPMMIFAGLQIVFIPTLGGSPGHRILGMRLMRPGGGWVGLWRPIVRTALLVIVLPAVVWDADHRGLHDKAADTVLVRA